MNKRSALLIVFALLSGLYFASRSRHFEKPVTVAGETAAPALDNAEKMAVAQAVVAPQAAPAQQQSAPTDTAPPIAEKKSPLATVMQHLKQDILPIEQEDALKQEYQAKGHSPQAILDWSFDLGQVMLQALDDQTKADETYRFLKECFAGAGNATPFRAICAGNAKRLAEKFPSRFSQDFESARRELPDQIYNFLGTTSSF